MFVTTCLEYLGFYNNIDRITPLEDKVELIRKISLLTLLKQLQHYIGYITSIKKLSISFTYFKPVNRYSYYKIMIQMNCRNVRSLW